MLIDISDCAQHFGVLNHAKYLGIIIGHGLQGEQWQEIIKKYYCRIKYLKHLNISFFEKVIAYNRLAFPILSFNLQMHAPTAEVRQMEMRCLAILSASPHNSMGRNILYSLKAFGLPSEIVDMDLYSKAAMYRVVKRSAIFQDWKDLIRSALTDDDAILRPRLQ